MWPVLPQQETQPLYVSLMKSTKTDDSHQAAKCSVRGEKQAGFDLHSVLLLLLILRHSLTL